MLVAGLGAAAAAAPAATTSRVSVRTSGGQAGVDSFGSAVSAGGRYVVFVSGAADLVRGDTNGVEDVFVRDRLAGATTRVSVGPGGRQADGGSGREQFNGGFDAGISADGRYVAFSSRAANLVAGDTNGATDVFLRDRQAGTTRRVSVGTGGTQGDGGSQEAAVSADGRHVAFASFATNLVPGDTNDDYDVFVRDLPSGATRRVSVGPGGRQSNDPIGEFFLSEVSLSADGQIVAYTSNADNLVDGDNNGSTDVFVRDRRAGVTSRASVGSGGAESDSFSFTPDVSADGRFVAFASSGALVPGDTNGRGDIYVRNLGAGTTRRVSLGSGGQQANDLSGAPAISADGRYVAFSSWAGNLVAADTNGSVDVFVRDREARTTRRVSVGPGGRQGDSHSFQPAISADGRHITFDSRATNLVAADSNGVADVFARDWFGDAGQG